MRFNKIHDFDHGKVFRLLAVGKVVKQIADDLGVSDQAVIRAIAKKKKDLKCKTLPQLLATMALKNML